MEINTKLSGMKHGLTSPSFRQHCGISLSICSLDNMESRLPAPPRRVQMLIYVPQITTINTRMRRTVFKTSETLNSEEEAFPGVRVVRGHHQ